MIYTVTLNPVLDKTLTVPAITLNEVLRATAVQVDWGGKGLNVSRALLALGMESIVFGLAGGAVGQQIEEGMTHLGIATDFVHIAGETRTNVVVIDAQAKYHLKVNEPGPQVSRAELDALTAKIEQCARRGDTWVFCGSLPPGVPTDTYARLVNLVKAKGGRACLDTSGEALYLGCQAAPFLVKPNQEEIAQAVGMTVDDESSAKRAVDHLLAMGIEMVALSLGAAGLLVATSSDAVRVIPPVLPILNPVGAGDAALAGILWALAQGMALPEIARWGAATGTAAAMTAGTQVGSMELVASLVGKMTIM
ncbi:MAG TPA: 1-phosphofructokinase [Anaerolineaceae bacterium]